MQDRLFVCTTGADAPAVYYLDVTTSLHLIVNLVAVVVVIVIVVSGCHVRLSARMSQNPHVQT